MQLTHILDVKLRQLSTINLPITTLGNVITISSKGLAECSIDGQSRAFWSNEADTNIKLYNHTDKYLVCVKIYVWQEAADAFGPWPTIKI